MQTPFGHLTTPLSCNPFPARAAFLLTQCGEGLINLLASVEKRLVTPETRCYVEEMMGEVERGSLSLRQAEEKSIKIYKELYDNLALAIQNQRQPRG